MTAIRVYSRQGCHLCEQLIEELLQLLRRRHSIEIRDIDNDINWQGQFGERIPVVEIDGRIICEHRLDVDAIESALPRGR
ncbi:MAG: glutaredoxin family protein [Woeseia sp.]